MVKQVLLGTIYSAVQIHVYLKTINGTLSITFSVKNTGQNTIIWRQLFNKVNIPDGDKLSINDLSNLMLQALTLADVLVITSLANK